MWARSKLFGRRKYPALGSSTAKAELQVAYEHRRPDSRDMATNPRMCVVCDTSMQVFCMIFAGLLHHVVC